MFLDIFMIQRWFSMILPHPMRKIIFFVWLFSFLGILQIFAAFLELIYQVWQGREGVEAVGARGTSDDVQDVLLDLSGELEGYRQVLMMTDLARGRLQGSVSTLEVLTSEISW